MLNPNEFNRYQRHIALAEIGVAGQLKLKAAKVLVVGAGGLGTPVLQYLTAAGIGTIGIVDGDLVDESNLQRQVIYQEDDISQSKVEVAVNRLRKLNSEVTFISFKDFLTRENALEILKGFDLVVDGTDNFETRFLLGDASLILNKPLVHGSIFKFEGQVTVFNYLNGPSLRCLFPVQPKKEDVPNCSAVGVLGVLPGLIGMQMAGEVMKMVLGIGSVLSGKLLVTNMLTNQSTCWNIIKIEDNFARTQLNINYSLQED